MEKNIKPYHIEELDSNTKDIQNLINNLRPYGGQNQLIGDLRAMKALVLSLSAKIEELINDQPPKKDRCRDGKAQNNN